MKSFQTLPPSRPDRCFVHYGYAAALEWFQEREADGLLSINYATITYRCRTEIAKFSDTIFDADWKFPPTTSVNYEVSGHDGVFLIHSKDLDTYIEHYQPRCLRYSASSGKQYELEHVNFKGSKGSTFERVLIVPTGKIEQFISKSTLLESTTAAAFYVAVTRAKQSLAIVIDKPGNSKLPIWKP
ncbi:hypothetical protein [Pseudomonas sp. H9]|uniref:hypothetical protein n=1 Tax=Pseudomonas sp. H9 TaxID=483968 RepID=UPI0015B062E8|nr:hypothetical protein [Pseudomonas sp. H9]